MSEPARDSRRVRMLQARGRGGQTSPGMAAGRSFFSQVAPKPNVNSKIAHGLALVAARAGHERLADQPGNVIGDIPGRRCSA